MNSKAAAAKEKKEQAKDVEKSKKAKAEEDAVWAAAGEGARSKAQSKKDDQVKYDCSVTYTMIWKFLSQSSICIKHLRSISSLKNAEIINTVFCCRAELPASLLIN